MEFEKTRIEDLTSLIAEKLFKEEHEFAKIGDETDFVGFQQIVEDDFYVKVSSKHNKIHNKGDNNSNWCS